VDQRYVIAESVQHGYVGGRDARTFVPFLLPHLRPDMDVLDVGCGVGSIALDLAPMVAPGRVAGVDADYGQIEAARTAAAERAIENAEFHTSSVYDLPFEDASFDVVYANAVLLYLRDPVAALVEMRRVLRPGGLAAVCDDDGATFVMSPDCPQARRAVELFEQAIVHEGGNPRSARHVRSLMLDAGFARTRGIAHAPEVYGDGPGTRWFADFLIGAISAASMADVIVGEGWATHTELDAMMAALRAWGDKPHAFASWLYCGALGWVG
jgi:SAM-dependent methyltransferase